ncbi:MAG: thiol:disulfide interchange protein DsbA/DsbL [Herbaspirillum sp.]
MHLFRHTLAAISLGLLVVSAGASPANPQNGIDYRTLEQIQPTEFGDRIEVIEFFWYNCPHCAVLEPVLSAWVKKQGDRIVFRQVPIAFRDSLIPQQKLYYALEAMSKTAEMNPRIFQAIHVENQRIDTDKTILAFIEKQGIDKQKFLDMYSSFGIQTKVRRAAQLQEAYKIDGVPVLAIGGRFLTSPAMLGASMVNQPESMLNAALLQVVDYLVARLEAEKGSAGAGRKK